MTSSSEPISAAAFEQQSSRQPAQPPTPAPPARRAPILHDPPSPILREAGKSVLSIGLAAAVIVPVGLAGVVAAPVILAANLLRNRRKS